MLAKGNKIKTELKEKLKPTIPVLSDPDVKNHLEELHWKFVIVTIDKGRISFAFIFKNTTFPND